MSDPALRVTARRVTMAIRAPAVQRMAVRAPAPVRLTVKPRSTVRIDVPKQGPAGPAGRDGATVVRPEHSYSVAVAAGQAVIPISPPPTDPNGLALTVNGVAYGPPNSITVSAVALTWLGAFPLDPSDDVRVRYF